MTHLFFILLLFCALALLIRYLQPSSIFDKDGVPRPFGTGYDHEGRQRTPFHWILILLTLAAFLAVAAF